MNLLDDTTGKETSATRAAYVALRHRVLTGELPPGKKLKIEQLRTLLNTGASPVREALSLLTSDMLVERIDQRGFRAAPVSRENFEEILMLRAALEDMALRKSLANATPEWEERLVLAHHRMKRAVGSGTEAFEDAHKTFHVTLLDMSGSPTLERYCSQLYDLNIRYRFIASVSDNYQSRDIAKEHEDILEAAVQRDADLASERLLSHYRLTGDYLSVQIDEMQL